MPVPPPQDATQVFHGVLFDIWQWDQDQYDGTHHTYECQTRQDTVTIIAFVDHETVILTRQEQSGRGKPFIDFPGGRVEADETHEAAARREFLEETGLSIGRIMSFQYSEHHGSVRYAQTVFVATDLTEHPEGRHLDPGEKIEILKTPLNNVVRMSLDRELRQSEVMLAVLRLAYDPGSKQQLDAFLRS